MSLEENVKHMERERDSWILKEVHTAFILTDILALHFSCSEDYFVKKILLLTPVGITNMEKHGQNQFSNINQ